MSTGLTGGEWNVRTVIRRLIYFRRGRNMRREITECDDCGTTNNNSIKLVMMVVMINKKQVVIVGDSYNKPDFCGIPHLLRWINNKLTEGAKGGDTNGLG